jgi:hypothetical protein
MLDIDGLEFTYRDGRIVWVAIIDDKHGVAEKLSLRYAPMQAQLQLADDLKVPHFITVSYLHEEVPCYFVIGTNDRARVALKEFGCQSDRDWFSVRRYSQLQHALRGLIWNAFEVDKHTGERLGELSDAVHPYKLPEMSF